MMWHSANVHALRRADGTERGGKIRWARWVRAVVATPKSGFMNENSQLYPSPVWTRCACCVRCNITSCPAPTLNPVKITSQVQKKVPLL
jgi:hypothetical protein